MNPLLMVVTLVYGLAAGRRLGPAGPGAPPERRTADAAVATGLVALAGLVGLTGAVLACVTIGLAAVVLL